jgi:hypothetical protein
MATETPARAIGRPRTSLLVLLGLVITVFVVTRIFSSDSVPPAVSTGAVPQGAARLPSDRIDPAELDVKIETLNETRAAPTDQGARNPFRFQPKPAPAPAMPSQGERPIPQGPPLPQAPPGPPAIGTLIKFIGIVDTGKEKIGAFSDCRYTFSGREGEVIEGRFRVVRIGVESAELEYTDGRGRTTLPLNGRGCVGK